MHCKAVRGARIHRRVIKNSQISVSKFQKFASGYIIIGKMVGPEGLEPPTKRL